MILPVILFTDVQSASAISEIEQTTLLMFFEEDMLVMSPTRHLKRLAETPENITVITAEDIKRSNAHTILDVLYYINGVEVVSQMTPGSPTTTSIQSSDSPNVRVIVDGVTINFVSSNFSDLGSIPAQIIERVEIIKGPASSAWGSSLGGVINIITKSPSKSKRPSATLQASYGERGTGDYRAELTGSKGKIGYYLYAGRLESAGLTPYTAISIDNLYAKLTASITDNTEAYVILSYNKGERGLSSAPYFGLSFDSDNKDRYALIGFDSKISQNSRLNVSFRTLSQDWIGYANLIDGGMQVSRDDSDNDTTGGSALYTYDGGGHAISVGLDVDKGKVTSPGIAGGKQERETWAVYANDTINIGRASVTPGMRYDHTSTNGDFLSPSLGITYALMDNAILKASVTRGFNTPPLSATFATSTFYVPNPDLRVENGWSYNAGIETNLMGSVFFRTTFFRHDIRDDLASELIDSDTAMIVNKGKTRRQGFEIEAKTASFHNLTFSTDFIYIDSEDLLTGMTITNVPKYAYDARVQYLSDLFEAVLNARYIWWDVDPERGGKFEGLMCDLHITKSMKIPQVTDADIFLSVHNLLNAEQYPDVTFRNPERWIEGGLRVAF